MKRKVLLIAVLLVATMLLTSCLPAIIGGMLADEDSPPDKPADDPAPKPQEKPADSVYRIGDTVKRKRIELTVKSVVRDEEGSKYTKPEEGMVFVSIEVRVKNPGNSELHVNPLDFKIKTGNGEIFGDSFSASVAEEAKRLRAVDLAPGGETSGVVSFEVEKDSTLWLLYYESLFSSKPDIEIDLND